MEVSLLPRAPFNNWTVQLFDPLVGFFWYTEPAIFVSQSVAVHGSYAVIERQNDLLDRVLTTKRAEIERAGGLLILNDWRSVQSYDQDARERQRERMRARPLGYSRKTIIAVNPKSRLLRMAIEGANLFAALTLKSRIEVVLDPSESLRNLKVERPPANARFPA